MTKLYKDLYLKPAISTICFISFLCFTLFFFFLFALDSRTHAQNNNFSEWLQKDTKAFTQFQWQPTINHIFLVRHQDAKETIDHYEILAEASSLPDTIWVAIVSNNSSIISKFAIYIKQPGDPEDYIHRVNKP